MDALLAHEALADPTRLGIAQALLLGDLSPGEIGERWSLATPLVAHHLKMLVTAGLAVRTPGEHDRRRSYVSLRHDDPDVVAMVAIGAPGVPRPGRIAFVCTRNSARSKLAAAMWRGISDLPAVDAGTAPAPAPHPRTLIAAAARDLAVDPAMHDVHDTLAAGDLVITVCDHVHETWTSGRPRWHWSIPDPVADPTPRMFDRTCDTLAARIDDLRTALTGDRSHRR